MIIVIPNEFIGLSATSALQIQEISKPTDLVEVLSKIDFTAENVFVTVKDTRMFDILKPYESVLRWVSKVEGAVPVKLPFDESLIIDVQEVLETSYKVKKHTSNNISEDDRFEKEAFADDTQESTTNQ